MRGTALLVLEELKSMPLPTRIADIMRFFIRFIIAAILVSSAIDIFINAVEESAAATNEDIEIKNKSDTSYYHSTPLMLGTHFPIPSTMSTATTPSIQAALIGPATFRSTDIVNSRAIYEIAFITTTTATVKKIEITFPEGTIVGAAGVVERVGIGPGSLTKSGSTVTFTVTNAVSIPAGTYIRLEMVDVGNPPSPSSNYKISVTTRDPTNAIIDGPSESLAFIIKQLGTAEIANNAITKEKISSSFMTSRILQDNARGDSFGWNPNGVITNFIIIDEDAITVSNPVLINVGDSGTNSQCEALGSLTGFFTIQCLNPPPQGSELRYTVVNLSQS